MIFQNEELKNELDENQKLLQVANQGISCLKKEVEDEKKLRGKKENGNRRFNLKTDSHMFTL